jgi:uncharacterized protein (TIGR02300 family)
MPKEEWGTKRLCPTTGKRFYDMNRNPPVSPYTGDVVQIETGKSRPLITEKAKPKAEVNEDDVVLDDDDNNTDVDLGDDILDDDDDDNVSLDDLADVASEDDES